MSVTYTAVLNASEGSVLFLSGLLEAERTRRGTRQGTRSLTTYQQAVLVLRWFLEDARRANPCVHSAGYAPGCGDGAAHGGGA